MLDADMNVELWRLSGKFYSRLRAFCRIAAAVSGTSVFVSIVGPLSQTHPNLWKASLLAAVVIGIFSEKLLPNSADLEHMNKLVSDWKKLCVEFELLYAHDCELLQDESWNRFKKLQSRTVAVHGKDTSLPYFYPLHWWATRRVIKKRGLKYE